MKEIEIWSLAEWEVFWAVIHNFLGWSHSCTYMTSDDLKPHNHNLEEIRKETLRKVAEKGGKLHVNHLFEPFVHSDLPQSERHFYDNGIRLMRLILKTEGLEVVWDIPDTEKEILLSYSPPLYHKIFD